MEARKTHFEQVPVQVAEKALRLPSALEQSNPGGSPYVRKPVSIRMGPRRRSVSKQNAASSRKEDPLALNTNGTSRTNVHDNPAIARRRRMVWITTAQMEDWACSECGWAFRPSGPPVGRDLEEMKQNYERQRDTEYGSHVCAEHARNENDRHEPGSSRPRDRRPSPASAASPRKETR